MRFMSLSLSIQHFSNLFSRLCGSQGRQTTIHTVLHDQTPIKIKYRHSLSIVDFRPSRQISSRPGGSRRGGRTPARCLSKVSKMRRWPCWQLFAANCFGNSRACELAIFLIDDDTYVHEELVYGRLKRDELQFVCGLVLRRTHSNFSKTAVTKAIQVLLSQSTARIDFATRGFHYWTPAVCQSAALKSLPRTVLGNHSLINRLTD